MMPKNPWMLALLYVCFATPVAQAHISLEQAGTHKSRYGDTDNDIKNLPCGRTGGARGTNIYTYEAGSTIEVEVSEFVSHPGYFRIAFDDDGDDDFEPPASISSEPPSGRPCMGASDKCGEADYYNNETVLPEMDNLGPHPDGENNKLWKWQVKLPNKPCDNCTLQIIQVMTEAFRAPYDPAIGGAGAANDIYSTCIDLVLTPAPGAAAGGAGGAGGASSAGGPASSGAGGAIGTTASAATGAAGSPAAGSASPPPTRPPVAAVPQAQPALTAGMAAPAPMSAAAAAPEASGCSLGSVRGRSHGAAAFLLAGLTLALARRRRPSRCTETRCRSSSKC
jgi:hypothetical protein